MHPQLEAYESFDPELRVLHSVLESEDKQAHNFEWGIASLLLFAGFQVQWLGFMGKALNGEIDIIAYDENARRAILGEVTIALGDIGKKVSILSERSSHLAGPLAWWEIKKVLFTGLSTQSIPTGQLDEAGQVDVVIVTRDALAFLLEAVRFGVPIELLWDRLNPNVSKNPERLVD